jgi:hypothetical protein
MPPGSWNLPLAFSAVIVWCSDLTALIGAAPASTSDRMSNGM